jgi:hypothetical protein
MLDILNQKIHVVRFCLIAENGVATSCAKRNAKKKLFRPVLDTGPIYVHVWVLYDPSIHIGSFQLILSPSTFVQTT